MTAGEVLLPFLLLFLFFSGLSQTADQSWNEIKNLYHQKNYQAVIDRCDALENEVTNENKRLQLAVLKGESYLELNKPKEASAILKKNLTNIEKKPLKIHVLELLAQTGTINENVEYYKRAYEISKDVDEIRAASIASKLGVIFNNKRDYKSAIYWMEQSKSDYAILGDKNGVLQQGIELAKVYSNYGDYKNAKITCTGAKKMASSLGDRDAIDELNGILETISNNQVAEANTYNEQSTTRKDNLIDSLKTKDSKSIGEIERLSEKEQLLEYRIKAQQDQYEKKQLAQEIRVSEQENKLLKNQAQLKKQKLTIAKRNRQISYFILALILVVILGLLFYRMYYLKKKNNQILKEKNKKINAQKEAIEDFSNQIQQSINYAKEIQQSIIQVPKKLPFLANSFMLLSKPKDVVSGDFFWSFSKDKKLYLAVADCTGHGVPGAFMSIVCSELLDEVMLSNDEQTPAEILNELLKRFLLKIKNQKQEIGGMDLSLICIDYQTNVLTHAGARNPAYIIRNGELLELKGSRISISSKMDAHSTFDEHDITLKKGDAIYLFSDGFVDQKGGDKKKKYFYKPFKELLISISNEPLQEQKQKLEAEFSSWRGDLPQMDDVMIFATTIE